MFSRGLRMVQLSLDKKATKAWGNYKSVQSEPEPEPNPEPNLNDLMQNVTAVLGCYTDVHPNFYHDSVEDEQDSGLVQDISKGDDFASFTNTEANTSAENESEKHKMLSACDCKLKKCHLNREFSDIFPG